VAEEVTAFYHRCEACGLTLLLEPEQAYDLGWDYPPQMGTWGTVSPRTCGECSIEKTVWWQLATQGKTARDLKEDDYMTVLWIAGETGDLRQSAHLLRRQAWSPDLGRLVPLSRVPITTDR
jgi:hypothetical protein